MFFSRKQDVLAALSRMDWGPVTPEFSNEQTWSLVHVFNHDLQNAASIERAVRFTAGRIHWYNAYLKNAFPHHKIVFDDEGQNIHANTRQYIRRKLNPLADEITFCSEMEGHGL